MSSKPKRIRRRRAKGWRMPRGARYCGRPGKMGNPFDWMVFGRDLAVHFHRRWLVDNDFTPQESSSLGLDIAPEEWEALRRAQIEGLTELRGHDLACWCAEDQPCHVDTLLELANA
jgi:hypothetical protein